MAYIASTFLAPVLTIISTYAAQKSYIAITQLQQYEERSERAAKHSKTAADQLYKTRITQGSSGGAIALSLLSSLTLFSRSFSSTSLNSNFLLVLPLFNALAIAAAFVHNRGFWKAKAKVPFVEGFNEGIQKSKEIREFLVLLEVGWVVVGVAGVWEGVPG